MGSTKYDFIRGALRGLVRLWTGLGQQPTHPCVRNTCYMLPSIDAVLAAYTAFPAQTYYCLLVAEDGIEDLMLAPLYYRVRKAYS